MAKAPAPLELTPVSKRPAHTLLVYDPKKSKDNGLLDDLPTLSDVIVKKVYGLLISKGIVDAYHPKIVVVSPEGEGEEKTATIAGTEEDIEEDIEYVTGKIVTLEEKKAPNKSITITTFTLFYPIVTEDHLLNVTRRDAEKGILRYFNQYTDEAEEFAERLRTTLNAITKPKSGRRFGGQHEITTFRITVD